MHLVFDALSASYVNVKLSALITECHIYDFFQYHGKIAYPCFLMLLAYLSRDIGN